MKKLLLILGIFLFGMSQGFLIQKAFFVPKVEIKYDVLPIDSKHEIKIEDKAGEKYLHLNYETFKYIVQQNKGKEVLKKIDALYYRMDSNFVPTVLEKKQKEIKKEHKKDKEINKNIG